MAILRGNTLLASEVSSQIAIHAGYGGVVPEVASRNHLRMLRPVVEAALTKAGVNLGEVDAFAATRGPGLATSLMIGLSAAKGMALGFRRPFVAVNHIEAHLLSPFFRNSGSVAGTSEGFRSRVRCLNSPRLQSRFADVLFRSRGRFVRPGRRIL